MGAEVHVLIRPRRCGRASWQLLQPAGAAMLHAQRRCLWQLGRVRRLPPTSDAWSLTSGLQRAGDMRHELTETVISSLATVRPSHHAYTD